MVVEGDPVDHLIRLWGIDAPEMKTSKGPPPRDALSVLIEGRMLACEPKGTSYNRIVAQCFLGALDVSAEMVRQVEARDCPRYSGGAYAAMETDASEALPMGGFCRP